MGTSNRLARVVDRTRIVASRLAQLEPHHPEYAGWAAQLNPLRVRAELLLKALRAFYVASEAR